MNHSCDPNVAFEVPPPGKDQWVVRALKDLDEGEVRRALRSQAGGAVIGKVHTGTDIVTLCCQVMTFAYWTTEWSMDQPFDCLCGTERCVGRVTGAKEMKEHVLAGYPLNRHIILQKKVQLGLGEDQELGGPKAE